MTAAALIYPLKSFAVEPNPWRLGVRTNFERRRTEIVVPHVPVPDGKSRIGQKKKTYTVLSFPFPITASILVSINLRIATLITRPPVCRIYPEQSSPTVEFWGRPTKQGEGVGEAAVSLLAGF